MAKDQPTSIDSLIEANRERGQFSGYGGALGAAGHRELNRHPKNCAFLRKPGDCIALSPGAQGFEEILIGGAWERRKTRERNPLLRLFRTTRGRKVDLDLGCLYEMQDGNRGAIQAFGEKFGAYAQAPYIALSGDERTGDKQGMDETLRINGAHWKNIKRLLIYIYIYKGAPSWAAIKPEVIIDVPGEQDLVMSPGVHNDDLPLCAIGGLENVNNGIKLTNYSEYFPGHAEMDRAYGFGLNWEDGKKR